MSCATPPVPLTASWSRLCGGSRGNRERPRRSNEEACRGYCCTDDTLEQPSAIAVGDARERHRNLQTDRKPGDPPDHIAIALRGRFSRWALQGDQGHIFDQSGGGTVRIG